MKRKRKKRKIIRRRFKLINRKADCHKTIINLLVSAIETGKVTFYDKAVDLMDNEITRGGLMDIIAGLTCELIKNKEEKR